MSKAFIILILLLSSCNNTKLIVTQDGLTRFLWNSVTWANYLKKQVPIPNTYLKYSFLYFKVQKVFIDPLFKSIDTEIENNTIKLAFKGRVASVVTISVGRFLYYETTDLLIDLNNFEMTANFSLSTKTTDNGLHVPSVVIDNLEISYTVDLDLQGRIFAYLARFWISEINQQITAQLKSLVNSETSKVLNNYIEQSILTYLPIIKLTFGPLNVVGTFDFKEPVIEAKTYLMQEINFEPETKTEVVLPNLLPKLGQFQLFLEKDKLIGFIKRNSIMSVFNLTLTEELVKESQFELTTEYLTFFLNGLVPKYGSKKMEIVISFTSSDDFDFSYVDKTLSSFAKLKLEFFVILPSGNELVATVRTSLQIEMSASISFSILTGKVNEMAVKSDTECIGQEGINCNNKQMHKLLELFTEFGKDKLNRLLKDDIIIPPIRFDGQFMFTRMEVVGHEEYIGVGVYAL